MISRCFLGKLAGALIKVAVPLVKNVLAPIATMALAVAIDGAIQGKMYGQGAIASSEADVVRAGKGITLEILNTDIDIIN